MHTTSRREFLKSGVIATGAAMCPSAVFAASSDPAVGLIFPPLNYPIPPDAKRLYPSGVEFLSGGVGLPGGMTLEGYDEAIPRVLPEADRLAKAGARVISVFGSSLTFYKGAKFNEELVSKVTKLTGRLKIFLEEHGFEVISARGLGFERIPAGAATEPILFKLGVEAYTNSKADALVMSCGALKTLDLIVPLEDELKVPVVSSTPHGLMNAVRLLGVSPRSKGFGIVLSRA